MPLRAEPAAPSGDPVAERRLGALLAAAREARPERIMPPRRAEAPEQVAERILQRAALEPRLPQARLRRPVEDDIFDDEPLTLDVVRGAAR